MNQSRRRSKRVRTELLMLAWITLAFELFTIVNEPLPPLIVIGKFCPVTTEAVVYIIKNLEVFVCLGLGFD